MQSIANWLAVFGLALCAVTYAARGMQGPLRTWFVAGTMLLTCGYLAMFAAKVMDISDSDKGMHQDHGKDKQHAAGVRTAYSVAAYVGYACLFLFFALTALIPAMTDHRRWYDNLAALGYGLSLGKKVVPAPVMYVPLGLYYFFAALRKAMTGEDRDWVNIVQLVARVLLVGYYSVALASHVTA